MLTASPTLDTSRVSCLTITGLFFCMSSSISNLSCVFPSTELCTTTGVLVVICPYSMAIVAPSPNMPRACLSPNFEPYRTVPNASGMWSASTPGPLSLTVST